MFAHNWWAIALSWAGLVAAQEAGTGYQFTMNVASPAPIPGQPYTITVCELGPLSLTPDMLNLQSVCMLSHLLHSRSPKQGMSPPASSPFKLK